MVRYRYDTETGFYYLQSRYYNPEWGRFINADAIAGSIGELLGHNIFAYCKNNFISMKDPNGFAAQRVDGDLGGISSISSPKRETYSITKNELIDFGKSIAKNAGTGYVGYLATHLSKHSKLAFNREMERAGQYLLIPGSKIAKGIGAGLAVFGVVDTIISIKDDWNESKSWQEKAGKIAIDLTVFTFSTIVGATASPAVGAAVGFGFSIIGDAIKNYYWDN